MNVCLLSYFKYTVSNTGTGLLYWKLLNSYWDFVEDLLSGHYSIHFIHSSHLKCPSWEYSGGSHKHDYELPSYSEDQRSLYVPSYLTLKNSTFCPHSVFMCPVRISEQTVIISLCSINWLGFINQTECVYCAVRAWSLNAIQVNFNV
jgi:hypothetical protein